ncbi:MAG: GNAT family N-acetyltransferase [Maribacter sp.]|nr:GNAT family N-acetyltransferase [Maribacter sp.]
MIVEILQPDAVNKAFQKKISELYKQLNANIQQLPIKNILQDNENLIFAICQEDDKLVGMAMMATYQVISGYKGIIEDVVVDENYRRKGIGRKLMERLLSEGKKGQLTEILLFSGHHRLPAINLYKSLGFVLKDSGLYTLKLA